MISISVKPSRDAGRFYQAIMGDPLWTQVLNHFELTPEQVKRFANSLTDEEWRRELDGEFLPEKKEV